MLDAKHGNRLVYLLAVSFMFVGLYITSTFSYLLFHSLVEITTVSIGFAICVLALNARRFLKNDFLFIVGVGYTACAVIDLLHTIAYKGMRIIPTDSSNLPTELWISARYLQALTLLIAPVFSNKKTDGRAIIAIYLAASTILITFVFCGLFPVCYIDGKGLTPFKIGSEYAITLTFLGSLALMFRQKSSFTDRVFTLVVLSIGCMVVAELSFTSYVNVYGPANLIGHLFKLAAYGLIYQAIVVTGFKDPFDLIFRDMKDAEMKLREARDSLEEQVNERTEDLRLREERHEALFEGANDAIFLQSIGVNGQIGCFMEANAEARKLLEFSREEFKQRTYLDLVAPEERQKISTVRQDLLEDHDVTFESVLISKNGRNIPVDVSARIIKFGETHLVFSVVRDITERKASEEALHRVNRELQALSDCNQALMRAVDEQTLLNEICQIVCNRAGYRMTWVGLAENDEDKSVRPVAWAGAVDGYIEQLRLSWSDSDRGRGPTGRAIRTGEVTFIRDFETDPDTLLWRAEALQRGYRSSIALPLKDESFNTFGALTIYSAVPGNFTPGEVRLLEQLAADLAYGITALRIRKGRDRAEVEVRNREALYRSVVNAMAEGACLQDSQGKILAINPAGERILGRLSEQAYGLGSEGLEWQTIHEDGTPFPGELHPAMVTLRTGKPQANVIMGIHQPDGNLVWISVNSEPLVSEGNSSPYSVVTTFHDITERKRVEKMLLESEERLRLTLEATQIGIWDWDVKNDRWYASPIYHTMLGYEPTTEGDRDSWIQRLHPDDREQVHAKISNVLNNDFESYEYEARLRHANGSYRWQRVMGFGIERDVNGKVNRLLGVRMDIDAKKQTEEALKRLNRELRAISDCNQALVRAEDEGTLLADICKIICEEAGYRMTWVGFAQPDEAKTLLPVAWAGAGDDYLSSVNTSWAEADLLRDPAGTAVLSGEPVCLDDFEMAPRTAPWRTKALELGYGSCIALPLKNEGALTFGVLCIYSTVPFAFHSGEVRLLEELASDLAFGITTLRTRAERNRVTEDVRHLNQELEQRIVARTAQLEAANNELEAFAYSVSHDLRAPLRHIDGFSRILLEDFGKKLGQEGREHLDKIRASAQRMDHLIDDLLKLSRVTRSSLSRSNFDLSEMVSQIASEYLKSEPERRVVFAIEPKCMVNADRNLIRILLENVLGNAWKYTGKTPHARIDFGWEDSESERVFYIRDNGAGFDMAYADKLFGAFQRLHSSADFPGTGIGLATVQRIVSRHEGRAWLIGEPDKGATLYFTLQ